MYVTTDTQYAENCDDKYMFMDYVSSAGNFKIYPNGFY